MQERSADGDAQKRVDRIVAAMIAAFPDADVDTELVEPPILEPVDVKYRHVVATAIAAHADAIVTFNVKDFAPDHLKEQLQIEVIHPDDLTGLIRPLLVDVSPICSKNLDVWVWESTT
jgi:hypothetical protein